MGQPQLVFENTAYLSFVEKLMPIIFISIGDYTIGNSSQVSDGAGAVLLMKRSVAMQKGLPILGVFRFVDHRLCFSGKIKNKLN